MPSKKRVSNYDQLFSRAKECFGDNLIDVGVGGSGCRGSDIDAVVILRKMNFDQIKSFQNDRISVIPMTEMMFDNRNMWPDKLITMVLKGLDFDGYVERISKDEAKDLTKPLIPEAIYRINKAVMSGKIDEKRALDLVIQYLAIFA